RVMYGRYQPSMPSRFMLELPPETLHVLKGKGARKRYEERPAGNPVAPGRGSEFTSAQAWLAQARSAGTGAATEVSAPRTATVTATPAPKPQPAVDVAAAAPTSIVAGVKVRHIKWGLGTVIAKEGEGDGAQVKVAFPGLGVKTLILGYANLELIN
ncbi:MAG TPA: hypothetical protein VHY08_04115, partial [Bacillota bacterium]|nr:hypothetical protein [Bacillota bacterium]